MSYQVIARKYRPQRFNDVVGQEHVTQTLANAIKQKRTAHAYLFCGPRGTGKTTIARIFAKCLNCTGGPKVDFDDNDPRCQEITEGRSIDVLEIDGASNNGVEQVRELRDTVKYSPASSKFKIYIIDEVHMLTTAAFNALLKTLEEPPAHVKFVFATTEPEKVLAITGALIQGEAETALRELNDLAKKGKDLGRLVSDLLNHFRNLLIFQVSKGDLSLLEVSDQEAAMLAEQAPKAGTEALTRVM